MRISYPTLITATALTLLSACATNTASQANNTETTPARVQTATAPGASVQGTPVQADSTETPFKEGTVAEFSATETTLDKPDIANINKDIEAFKQAKSIEVTGYCDRKDNVLRAQQVALSRASAVRAELIKQGVSGSKIHLKYRTGEARHSVVVVLK